MTPPRPVGANGDARAPTADEKDLLEADTLRISIQGVSCDEYASIEVVALRTQVVAGTNYSVKYRVTAADSSVSYILAKIFVALPHMNALPQVTAVQKVQVTETSRISFNTSLLHTEQCQPAQPVNPVDPSSSGSGTDSGDDSGTTRHDILRPEDFEAFKAICDRWGYTFEPFQVTTDDDWVLTLFRITGKIGEPARIYLPGNKPIFFQHGMYSDAATSIAFSIFGKPWSMSLFDAGYDVWFGNNRATRYSEGRAGDAAGQSINDEEHWQWTTQDLAEYDVRSQVDKVLEVTGMEKLTYIGYSRGTAQVFLALAMDQAYYSSRINKVIALAPCMYLEMDKLRPGGVLDYQGAVDFYENAQS